MEELESRLIASKFSLGGPGGSGYGTAPTKGQCAFYKWSQDEDSIVMEIPLPRRAMKRDIKLAAGPKTFQLAVKSSPELGVLAGEWYGEIDPTSLHYELVGTPPPRRGTFGGTQETS
eukprot:CAMPEP_0172633152 /NCGR_PEP_ID=MMETSP1068-20121228/187846_1 /TAXON_ID=35684 /ORGANISM="Pseudopedinella elastica, Strain CCMP716" /LENGTH=116 /DNA_ID=CAMNT_0013444763 /DNA_START=45 /DNA_END=392 /DNA_ORIENTATION=-